MNLKINTIASLFAIGALVSMGAIAASDAEKTAENKPAAPEVKKKVKPHSHIEEKGGIVASVSKQLDEKADPAKDKNKHLHPRDGK